MSNVNLYSAAINENFPVAGQDNDTQVFRDNFDSIKTGLSTASTEITALQEATQGLNLVAFDDTDQGQGSDFDGRIIYNAVLQNTFDRKHDEGEPRTTAITVDYLNGSYQVFRIGADVTVDFQNFFDSNAVTPRSSKVTIEFWGDGTARTLTFIASGGTVLKKNNSSFPSPFVVTSLDGAGGAGTATIIEVWQHDSSRIFLNYVGQFGT